VPAGIEPTKVDGCKAYIQPQLIIPAARPSYYHMVDYLKRDPYFHKSHLPTGSSLGWQGRQPNMI